MVNGTQQRREIPEWAKKEGLAGLLFEKRGGRGIWRIHNGKQIVNISTTTTPKSVVDDARAYYTQLGYIEDSSSRWDYSKSDEMALVFRKGDERIRVIGGVFDGLERRYSREWEDTNRVMIALDLTAEQRKSGNFQNTRGGINSRYSREIPKDLGQLAKGLTIGLGPVIGAYAIAFNVGDDLKTLGGDLVKLSLMYGVFGIPYAGYKLIGSISSIFSNIKTMWKNSRLLKTLESDDSNPKKQEKGLSFFRKFLHPFRYIHLKQAEKNQPGEKRNYRADSITDSASSVDSYDFSFRLSNSVDGKVMRLGTPISWKALEEFMKEQTEGIDASRIRYSEEHFRSPGPYATVKNYHYVAIDSPRGMQTILVKEIIKPNRRAYP
jgi:hypothetical protein